MTREIVDPVPYAMQRANEVHVTTPGPGEEEFASEALGAHFSLFNDCPLFFTLLPRERRRYVRRWIQLAIADIDRLGFVAATKHWQGLGNLFLRGFSFSEKGSFTFEASEALILSPIASTIFRLKGLPTDDHLYYEVVRWILSWHFFLAKLSIGRPDLRESAETAWLERQEQVIDANTISSSTIDALRIALGFLYDEDLSVEERHGKHGPGSTNLGHKTIPEKELAYIPCIQSQEITRYDPNLRPYVLLSEPDPSKWEVVPKDAGSLRPITEESSPMQHAQQAVKRIVYRYTDLMFVMAGLFVRYRDQTPSQKLALEGSRFSKNLFLRPVTVDLSSASDFLSADLVALTFPSNLVHEIMCARTPKVSVGKRLVPISMYAGMGSATTFPVQTLMFTAISLIAVCVALFQRDYGFVTSPADALREYLGQQLKTGGNWSYFKRIRVYGDDIIVPEIAVPHLLLLLERCGLRVNANKSFTGLSATREACGVYAVNGADITPLRFRVPLYNTKGLADFAIYDAYRSLANASFYYGYRTLYRFTIRKIKGLVPFISGSEARKKYARKNRNTGSPDRMLHTDLELLFEEPRDAKADHVGIVSNRSATYASRDVFGEKRRAVSALAPKLDTSMDLLHEGYHYGQNRFEAVFRDIVTEAHGRIPRGIRLTKRIAYLRRYGDKTGWAWDPQWS
jgi:hypothetical protein